MDTRRIRKGLLATALNMSLPVCSAAFAQDIVVNINGAVSGYDPINGFVNPVTLTLPPGHYVLSDGFGHPNALYGAYNQYATAYDDWYWNFTVGNIANGSAILTMGEATPYQLRRLAVEAGRKLPHMFLTLPTTTTLEFGVDDSYVTDNSGGISVLVKLSK
jgi:hypothetical protein